MKSRLKKKLAKKTGSSDGHQPSSQSNLGSSMALLATECWRIKKLLPELSENRKSLVLKSSVERMISELAKMGVEIEDPEQSEFHEGMTLRVALFEETAALAAGKTDQPAVKDHGQPMESAGLDEDFRLHDWWLSSVFRLLTLCELLRPLPSGIRGRGSSGGLHQHAE